MRGISVGSRPFRRGFTLLELLVCTAIAAGLATWGIPMMRGLARDTARTGQVNSFIHAIHLARSEAIKRNGVVSLCPTRDGRTCAPGRSWSTGWLVFVNGDADSPAARDPGEELLRAHPSWDAGHVWSNRTTLSFRAFGQMGVTATITFCDERGAPEARAVIISQTGRPRVSARSASRGPLECGPA
jgi:type IV fimbrial biogenesis protein FimT